MTNSDVGLLKIAIRLCEKNKKQKTLENVDLCTHWIGVQRSVPTKVFCIQIGSMFGEIFDVFCTHRIGVNSRQSPILDWTKNRRSSGTCIDVVYKNRPTCVHLVAELGVFWPASALLSFHPSSEPLLRHFNMSFAGARQFVASNNTFYEAKTVSRMFGHQAS